MNKQLLLKLLFAATLVSLFAYAFFDITWWAPIGKDDIVRAMIVTQFHVVGLMSPLMWGWK